MAECLETFTKLASTKPTMPYLRDGMAGSSMLQAIACAGSYGSSGTGSFCPSDRKQDQIWGGMKVGRGLDGVKQYDQLPSLLIELIKLIKIHIEERSVKSYHDTGMQLKLGLGSPSITEYFKEESSSRRKRWCIC